eukprot:TRINITY_DN1620_c2_g1_i1.p1 TRINITY_DN1620_c2_g1~~TRINITY_DN1620_c2_g1_i1.p1  ORF type:complete len:243 (+),score=46.88 TRINITY_DN1620_c2_g1_i1:232-960(+)
MMQKTKGKKKGSGGGVAYEPSDAHLNLYLAQDLPEDWHLPRHLTEQFDPDHVTKETLPIPNKEAFLLRHVLTAEECAYIITKSESLGYRKTDYPQDYRGNTRIIVDDLPLAQLVWERAKPHVPTMWIPRGKVWNAVGLNERWRLCKYIPGQQFGAHHDATFHRSGTERSFFTFMLYLNDVTEGGSTNFLERDMDAPKLKIPPEAGLLLCFQHDILHEGEKLAGGLKYLLRSDVMFQQQDISQ